MKTRFCLTFFLLFILLLSACATTAPGSDAYIEKKQSGKKLLFEDWKYKGFGRELPVWFEAAYHNDLEKIRQILPELAFREIIILRAEGINSDQADKILKIKEEESSSEYTVYDAGWALQRKGKHETYIALAVLYKQELIK